ncbi:MAG: hypothetical protein ABR548_11840 [Actinomycetota bacterium]|nr:hypothetical protein [Actinomycetota bacterium]
MGRLWAGLIALAYAATAFAPRPGGADPPVGRWVPGDLDVHSTYSYDVCSAPPVPNNCDPDHNGQVAPNQNVGRAPIDLIHDAELRGLAFIAFTDHNTPSKSQCEKPAFPGPCSAQKDPAVADYKACHVSNDPEIAKTCPVLVLDGQEKDLVDDKGFPAGRAGVIGFSGYFPDDPTPANGWSASDVAAKAADIRNAGGVVAAFEPTDRVWPWRYDPVTVPLDGFMAWSGSWLDQREVFGPDSTDNPRADDAWQGRVTTLAPLGKKLPLLASSDVHTIASSASEGPGMPSLWVYDTVDAPNGAVTWNGLKDGIQKGHIHVSFTVPSLASHVYLETVGGSIGGDIVPKASNVLVRVRWDNAPLGSTIRIIGRNGIGPVGEQGQKTTIGMPGEGDCVPPDTAADPATLATWRCNGQSQSIALPFRAGAWYRAELYVEDAAYPQAFLDAPSRADACVNASVWNDAKTCFGDRYLLLALTNPLYSSL